MNDSNNTVHLVGHLATQPRHRVLGDAPLTDFLLAVSRPMTDPSFPAPEPDFVPITAFGPIALETNDALSKADHVAVDGRIRTRRWTDGDGTLRSTVDVLALGFEVLENNTAADHDALIAAS